jgi:hypothetical protein
VRSSRNNQAIAIEASNEGHPPPALVEQVSDAHPKRMVLAFGADFLGRRQRIACALHTHSTNNDFAVSRLEIDLFAVA